MTVADRLAPGFVALKLKALALALNRLPSARHHLRDRHPLGIGVEFNADIQFATSDRSMGMNVRCRGGRMRVRRGFLERPDVTVRFRGLPQMRTFFTPGTDSMEMLMENDIAVEGNTGCLFKFGHMSAAVLTRNRKSAPKEAWETRHGPASWESLKAGRAGETCPPLPESESCGLSDPYLARYSLDDLPRIKRLLWTQRTRQPEVCTERPLLLTEFLLRRRMGGADCGSRQLLQAEAVRHILENKEPIIYDDDLLAGTTTARRIGVLIFPEAGGTEIWPELLTLEARDLNPYRISEEDIEILNRRVFPFWITDTIREQTRRAGGDPVPLELDNRLVLYFLWKTQAVSHAVIDLPEVLSLGVGGFQERARSREESAENREQREFYRSLQIALSGVLAYARNCSLKAGELLDGLPPIPESRERREILERMKAACARVPALPPRTLWEAVQATWLLFVAQHQESRNNAISLGRLDLWWEPYFQGDLALRKGEEERERYVKEALELTCAFMLKATDHLPLVPNLGNRLFGGSSSVQAITLGGMTPDGGSAVGAMTWIFLKAAELLKLRDPNMNARYAAGINPPAYLRRICEVNLLTGATPSMHNDHAVIKAMRRQGFSPEEARDFSIVGCVEPTSAGRHYGHTASILFNLVAPLELALNDGEHPFLRERIGPATGDPRTFSRYDEFWGAYRIQLESLLDNAVRGNDMLGRTYQRLKPTPLLSALFPCTLESGKDLIQGGALHNSSGVAVIGLTDVVDSLTAIRILVFEKKEIAMDALLEALAADYRGFEALHARVIKKVPKFGQDHPLPTAVARELTDLVFELCQARVNYRGGRYFPGYWSMSNHVAFGLLSGALPSGRRKGEPFTPGLTPSRRALAGLTDQMRAVAALDSATMPNNLAFNVKLVPAGHDLHRNVLDRMSAYVAAYFELGGMQMQFNVVSNRTLIAAMEHPEEYGDLMVRISGYNAYFVELNRNLQLEVIGRMEHRV